MTPNDPALATGNAVMRGFPAEEYIARTAAVQQRMAAARLDALLLTAAAEIRYFSGFLTQFWHSPTRPWFLIIPANGKPIAVIPEIGESGMAATWLDDIRCWPSPRPQDEGISLLTSLLREKSGRYGQIGMMLGAEGTVRMPLVDWQILREAVQPAVIVDCADLLQRQMMIKSPHEIDKIRHVAELTSAAFEALPQITHAALSERELCRRLRLRLTENGADESPYLIAASGRDGYGSIIMGPSDAVPAAGEVVMIDTGTVFDGYFCDFDRNYAIGEVAPAAAQAHQILWQAVTAGVAAARPGVTAAAVWQAMQQVLPSGGGNSTGRMGHGFGMQLTERPSLTAADETVLQAGMTLAIEPCMTLSAGKQIVCEENIVIGEDGAQWLSHRAAAELPVIV